jgi:hypothetical protein
LPGVISVNLFWSVSVSSIHNILAAKTELPSPQYVFEE